MRIIALVVILCSPLCVKPAHSQNDTIPQAIADYYTAVNFAVTFSTDDERQQLATLVGESPEGILDERLGEVLKRMQIVAERERQYDTAMLISGEQFPYLASRIARPEEIVVHEEDRIVLRVVAVELSMEQSRQLISAFEEGFTLPMEVEEDVDLSQELHEWIKRDGHWTKQPASLRLLRAPVYAAERIDS